MAVEDFNDTVTNAFNDTCSLIPRKSTKNVPWWNNDLAKLRKQVSKKFNKT